MDLSFEEKSAWGSLLAIGVASWLFFPDAIQHLSAGGDFSELMRKVVFVIGVIIVIEIVYHSIAASSSNEHDADERDRHISLRADRNAGCVLAVGVVIIVAQITLSSLTPRAPQLGSIDLVAVYLLLALTASEASKLLWQIWYYRTGS